MCLENQGVREMTISDIYKNWIESNPPTELENNHNQEGEVHVHSTNAG